MSGTKPVPTFVRFEEGRHTLTVYFRTDTHASSMTFSTRGEPEGYALKTYWATANFRPGETSEVGLYFVIDGYEGIVIQETTDAAGVVTESVRVTHSLTLEMPNEDSHRLTSQLTNFLRPTKYVVEQLLNGKPHLDALAFGDDHFTITNGYSTFTLGMTPDRYRFTFADYGLRSAPIRGFLYLSFAFVDENGEPFRVQFAAAENEAVQFHLDLKAFIKAHQETNELLESVG